MDYFSYNDSGVVCLASSKDREASVLVKDLLKKISIEHSRLILALLFTVIVATLFFNKVDLEPQVDSNIFFSSTDPSMQSDQRISKLFLRKDSQIIISAKGDIASNVYSSYIRALSKVLKRLPEVVSVKSITEGPASFRHAKDSPLWKRLLIANDFLSTNVILFIDQEQSERVLPKIEEIIHRFSQPKFLLRISGMPYVVNQIKLSLSKDFKTFTLLAFLIFSLVILWVFRSLIIFAGTIVVIVNTVMLTLLISHFMSVSIGLLTANLVTITFVLALSHVIFLTSNWRYLEVTDATLRVKNAIELTFPASFWSMLTTLLGFLSLLSVPAKPLRELGISGSIATFMAFVVVYVIYPGFLYWVKPPIVDPSQPKKENRLSKFLHRKQRFIRALIVAFILMMLPGIRFIDTDPSMMSFFKKDGEINTGLSYIDKNGGSSPFVIVVRDKGGELLDTKQMYVKMWNLQEALEQHSDVGSVVSLPVLIAEAQSTPITAFLSLNWLLKQLELPKYGQVSRSFITQDHKHGLYLLRMRELTRTGKRLEVVERLKQITWAHGFVPFVTGGIYELQGHLSQHVTSSLIMGLLKLIGFFVFIAFFVSRSLKMTLAMMGSLVLIPLAMLGFIGMYRIPLDVISSPASNVAMAMGIDAMIHIAIAHRLLQRKKPDQNNLPQVCNQMRTAVLTAMAVVMLGFSIFIFSEFPPTQRFGITIVFGTFMASMTALYIFPFIARKLSFLKY